MLMRAQAGADQAMPAAIRRANVSREVNGIDDGSACLERHRAGHADGAGSRQYAARSKGAQLSKWWMPGSGSL
jgi:hypothetical protein